jgi:carboxymethylenebutenolidase
MCDETTEAENEIHLRRKLSRREVALGAGATLGALITGCPSPAASHDPPSDAERGAPTRAGKPQGQGPSRVKPVTVVGQLVTVGTPDGSAEAFFVSPKQGKHPGVVMWPDVAGLRDAFKTMATRLAERGYAVLCVNPYYRSAQLPVLSKFADWQTQEGKAKVTPLRAALTPEAVTRDAVALTSWLDQRAEVDAQRKLAAVGYCMSGSFALRAAAAKPARVGVFASFHGGGLVTQDPNSPHLLLEKVKAAALICIAQNDDARAPEDKVVLQKAAKQAGIPAEIEVYPAQHGFCVIDAPVYDAEQAERAWARLLAALANV